MDMEVGGVHYPSATQILDWYHALEHLHDFAKVCLSNQESYNSWVGQQEQLKNSQVNQVIENIKNKINKGKST